MILSVDKSITPKNGICSEFKMGIFSSYTFDKEYRNTRMTSPDLLYQLQGIFLDHFRGRIGCTINYDKTGGGPADGLPHALFKPAITAEAEIDGFTVHIPGND